MLRNTPAYAGKTCVDRLHLWVYEKHPRLRGENRRKREVVVADEETPPLTRGKPRFVDPLRRLPGNTPAYAGKTEIRLSQWPLS